MPTGIETDAINPPTSSHIPQFYHWRKARSVYTMISPCVIYICAYCTNALCHHLRTIVFDLEDRCSNNFNTFDIRAWSRPLGNFCIRTKIKDLLNPKLLKLSFPCKDIILSHPLIGGGWDKSTWVTYLLLSRMIFPLSDREGLASL